MSNEFDSYDPDAYAALMDDRPLYAPSSQAFETLAANLTARQVEAASTPGALVVLAGAGTGKTSTLTCAVVHRIAVEGLSPSRILAVTFTNKAAAEMTGRIREALQGGSTPSWLGTFHGLGARQLRAEPEVAGLRPNFEIIDADDSRRLIKRIMQSLNLNADEKDNESGAEPVKRMTNQIGKFKDLLLSPEDTPAYVRKLIADANTLGKPIHPASLLAAARIYDLYQKRLRDQNSADFGDLLLWPTRALLRDAAYRTRWANRFDCILADEYQDVNYAQYQWLRALASSHQRLFCVGDDDQAIYGWRGADIAYIRRFTQDFPEAAVIRLEQNFRSTGAILNAANAVIARDPHRLGKTLFTNKGYGQPIEVVPFKHAEAEAHGIVEEIRKRHGEGVGFEAMTILYRNNFFSRGFEECLMRAKIPYVIVGDVGFYQRAEIKDTLAFLRVATTPNDPQSDEALRRVINEPRRGFGPKAMAVLEEEAAFRRLSLFRAIETAALPPACRKAGLLFVAAIEKVASDKSLTLADQLSLLLDATGYRAMLKESKAEGVEARLENIGELLQLAGSFHDAQELLDHAALATSRPNETEEGRLKLMTLHKSKGLEFDHVFLPGWEEGIFPAGNSDLDEERRLAYVAITRARHRAAITFCEFRRGFVDPSRFIADIPPQHRIDGWLRDDGAPPVQRVARTPLRPNSRHTRSFPAR
ncbi:ATP-dependent helicase [Beijerinckia mobilis]|uniref:ATP-dependent helicase n=1 Tax=Beijerinckia mobilis TaxID=231434 RepID=UPI000AC5AC77|nr:UvrD-helicase domain-containing protein [Beijerinckia mobilis]